MNFPPGVFTRNLLRGSHRRNIFFHIFHFDVWPRGLNHSLTSNKPTHYLQDCGSFKTPFIPHLSSLLSNRFCFLETLDFLLTVEMVIFCESINLNWSRVWRRIQDSSHPDFCKICAVGKDLRTFLLRLTSS